MGTISNQCRFYNNRNITIADPLIVIGLFGEYFNNFLNELAKNKRNFAMFFETLYFEETKKVDTFLSIFFDFKIDIDADIHILLRRHASILSKSYNL